MKALLAILLLAAALAFAGCETESYVSDARHPEIEITAAGGVTFRGEFVEPDDLPGLLRKTSHVRTDTIYISAPDDMADWRLKRKVMGILTRNGFTRPVLVGKERSSAQTGRTGDERRRDERLAREAKQNQRQSPRKREVRYK